MKPTVVVLAYGPNDVTLQAVRRAKALAGAHGVHVVTALAPGAAAAGACRSVPEVCVAPGTGTRALLDLLDGFNGDAPVLLIHDDVALTRPNLERMQSVLARRGGLVVPWSNDIGMDHFCGPLPPSKHAAGRLADRVSGLTEIADPRVVRPSCVLGTAGNLRMVTGSHVVDPRMRLEIVDLPITVSRAVVAHDSSCTKALAEPVGPGGRPLLLAAMIVKNEEAMLPGLLESLTGLVDGVVICDTGSTDATVAIAERYGARVIHRDWRDDFAWARNEGLEAAGDAWWILMVDADDRVVCPDPAGVRSMLATYIGEHEAFAITVENRQAVGTGPMQSSFGSPRIFRAGQFRYLRSIHEVLVDSATLQPPAPSRLDEVTVVHTGYQAEIMAARGKSDRNLEATKRDFDTDPTPKNALEYARALRTKGGEHERSYEILTDMMAEVGIPDAHAANATNVAYALTVLAEDAIALGKLEEGLKHAGDALALTASDDMAARLYAIAALALNRPGEVLAMEASRAERRAIAPVFRSDVARAALLSLVAEAHARTGDAPAALAVALESLRLAPEYFQVTAWPPIVAALSALPRDACEAALVELALADTSGEILPILVATQPPAATARLCGTYCERGGQHPEAIRVGLVAALLTGQSDTFEALAAHAGRLDAVVVERIAARASARDRQDLADLLQPMPARP